MLVMVISRFIFYSHLSPTAKFEVASKYQNIVTNLMENSTVSDPSDWPSTMTELRTIDNLLRCPICYEFMKTAMMIPECSHNFCSLCIRTYMAYKNQCPTCSISFLETNLKNNRVLDGVVKNFLVVRPHILQMCKDNDKQKSVTGSACVKSSIFASSEQVQSSKTSVATNAHPKNESTKNHLPKRSPSASKSSSEIDDPDFEPCKKSPRFRSNQTPKRTNLRTHFRPSASSTEEDEEDQVVDPSPNVSRQKHAVDENSPALSIPSPVTPSTLNNNPTRASCPVCGVSVLERFINTHLDKCLANEEKKDSLRTKRRPLLKFVCNLMSDKEIRKKLKVYNLSHQGPRQVLIKRLKEFALLYNSYCDTDNPKSVEAISKEYENVQNMKKKHSSDTVKDRFVVEKGKTDEEFDQSRKKYLASHKSQFDKMIEETRKRQLEMKAKASKSKAPSTECTAASSSIGSLEEGEKQAETQDKLALTQESSLTLSSDVARTQDLSQTFLRSELAKTRDSSQTLKSDFVPSHHWNYPQGTERDVILPTLMSVLPSPGNHLETSEAMQEADSNMLVLASQSEVSQDDSDEAQSKPQLNSLPSSYAGHDCIPESNIILRKYALSSKQKSPDDME